MAGSGTGKRDPISETKERKDYSIFIVIFGIVVVVLGWACIITYVESLLLK